MDQVFRIQFPVWIWVKITQFIVFDEAATSGRAAPGVGCAAVPSHGAVPPSLSPRGVFWGETLPETPFGSCCAGTSPSLITFNYFITQQRIELI